MRHTLLLAVAFGFISSTPAMARPATCFTTDDGKYPCDFKSTGSDGSFEITAAGKPSFSLVMDVPGVGHGFSVFEKNGRTVSLPGTFHRAKDDAGCWQNDETAVRVCAW